MAMCKWHSASNPFTFANLVSRCGMVPLSDILCPLDDAQSLVDTTGKDGNSSTPPLGEVELGQDGVPTKKGQVMTNDEVVKSGVWPELSLIDFKSGGLGFVERIVERWST